MKRFYLFLLSIAVVLVACQKENSDVVIEVSFDAEDAECVGRVRSYCDALKLAEELLLEFDGEMTRSSHGGRKIMADQGQCIMRSVTRNGEVVEEPMIYIFNNENDEGFIIVAADRTVSPVIAITESGNYTYGEPTGNESFDMYMGGAIAELESLLPPPTGPITPIINHYYVTREEVQEKEPLLSTKWGQWGIFDNYCPNGAPAGCVIMAMLQIMAYHEYPASFTTTYSSDYPYGGSTITLNWDVLLQHTEEHSDTDACNPYHYQLSALSREVGERVDCDYGLLTTGAPIENVIPAFQSLGYSTGILIESEDNEEVIYDELDDNRPLLMGGYRSNGSSLTGHVWVVDGYYDYKYIVETYSYGGMGIISPVMPAPGVPEGYTLTNTSVTRTQMLHINWGWDGRCNGWFNLGNYVTNDAEEYDSQSHDNTLEYSYMLYNDIVYNIYAL